MPKVSDNFGPIYQNVTLNGSGTGTVSFQAVGSAVRVSNIFFRVATTTAQAVCTIYKGQVAVGNIIFNSNSGSTGGNAKGNVDLFDGETLFVQWAGGDAGALATATFTGQKIPFLDMRPSNLTFDDPIAAGDGSLIFPALKSPNFVAGVSGWRITRTGDAEFNDITARGEVDIIGNNGSEIHIYTAVVSVNETAAIYEFLSGDYPDLFTPVPGPGQIRAGSILFPEHRGRLELQSPDSGGLQAFLQLYGASEEAGNDTIVYIIGRVIQLTGQTGIAADTILSIEGTLGFPEYSNDSGKGVVDVVVDPSSSAAISTVETGVMASDSITFIAGRSYSVTMWSSGTMSAVPQRAVSRLRKATTAGQQLGSSGHQFSTTTQGSCHWSTVFYVSGSDVTTALLWTGLVSAGATTITYTGAADSPRYMEIRDIGPASIVSGAGGPHLV